MFGFGEVACAFGMAHSVSSGRNTILRKTNQWRSSYVDAVTLKIFVDIHDKFQDNWYEISSGRVVLKHWAANFSKSIIHWINFSHLTTGNRFVPTTWHFIELNETKKSAESFSPAYFEQQFQHVNNSIIMIM